MNEDVTITQLIDSVVDALPVVYELDREAAEHLQHCVCHATNTLAQRSKSRRWTLTKMELQVWQTARRAAFMDRLSRQEHREAFLVLRLALD
ncbi:MAG: hypothetical protein ACTHOP_06375 [Mesorhizobium sp.]